MITSSYSPRIPQNISENFNKINHNNGNSSNHKRLRVLPKSNYPSINIIDSELELIGSLKIEVIKGTLIIN